MGTYLLRRILIAFPVLLGITIVSFVALSLAPGDPLTARLDPSMLAELQRNPALLQERRKELGLDQPVPVRYVVWLVGRRPGRLRLLHPVAPADRRGDRPSGSRRRWR